MSKVKNKTIVTSQPVNSYIKSLSEDEQQVAKELVNIFKEVTSMKPTMWGSSIVGFGSYHYKYESGREGDFLATGFSIRKSGPTIYIMPGYEDYAKILSKLGPHKLGKSCLYLKKLEGIDIEILKKLIKTGLKDLSSKYKVSER